MASDLERRDFLLNTATGVVVGAGVAIEVFIFLLSVQRFPRVNDNLSIIRHIDGFVGDGLVIPGFV